MPDQESTIFTVGATKEEPLLSPEEVDRLTHQIQWLTGERHDPPTGVSQQEILKRDTELEEHQAGMRQIAACAIWSYPRYR